MNGSSSDWFKWLVGTAIALLAAGGGIVALLNYFRQPAPPPKSEQPARQGRAAPPGERARFDRHDAGVAPSRVAVPDVAGSRNVDAAKRLRENGFDVREHSAPSARPPCTVVRTSPPAGSELSPGSAVTIEISQGEPHDGAAVVECPSAH